MIAASTTLLVPTTPVPVTPEVWALGGNDDEVSDTNLDVVVASRTQIPLARLIGLDRADDFVVEAGHSWICWRCLGIEHGFEVRSTSTDSCVCVKRWR